MSNVVEFLAQIGGDAYLRHAAGPEMEAALMHAGIEPAMRTALLADDTRLLESLIGANPNICCMVNVPEEEESEEEDDEGHEDEEDGEEEEDDRPRK